MIHPTTQGVGWVGENHYINNQKSAESPNSGLPMVMWPSGAEPRIKVPPAQETYHQDWPDLRKAQGNRNVLNLMRG